MLGTSHAGVSDIGSPAREDGLVCGLDVGMRSENAGNAAVEVVAHGLLLGGRLRVEVHEDIARAELREERVDDIERVVEGVHIDRSHYIHDRDLICAHVERADTVPGSASLGVIRGTDDVLLVEYIERLTAAESVVAGGEDVRAGEYEGLRRGARDAVALRGILGVHDGDVHAVGAFERTESGGEEVAARLADDVADE